MLRQPGLLGMTVRKLGHADALVGMHTIGGRTFLRSVACTVAAAALIASLSTAGQEIRPFDTPLRIEIVDLGASPYYPPGADSPPTALSCYYFPNFVVKEYYLGGRGAEWLSILLDPGEPPECKGSHERGERVIEYPEWEGHFKGAKGSLVFFDASDSVNGGLP